MKGLRKSVVHLEPITDTRSIQDFWRWSALPTKKPPKGHKIPLEALWFSPSGKTCLWPTPEGYGYVLGDRSWNLLEKEE
jgi:hypothetical protein